MAEHQPEDVAEYKVLLCIQITVISAARIKNTKGGERNRCWWRFSWEVDHRRGRVTGMKTALLVIEGRFFSRDVGMMRCFLGHRCSTTKLIVVPSKEGGAMILGPCCVVMLITGFLSELAAPPLAVTCPKLTGICSGPCGPSPVAL